MEPLPPAGTPGVGEFVGFAAGAALSEADQALQDFIDEMGCGAIVKTYNGGIACECKSIRGG